MIRLLKHLVKLVAAAAVLTMLAPIVFICGAYDDECEHEHERFQEPWL